MKQEWREIFTIDHSFRAFEFPMQNEIDTTLGITELKRIWKCRKQKKLGPMFDEDGRLEILINNCVVLDDIVEMFKVGQELFAKIANRDRFREVILNVDRGVAVEHFMLFNLTEAVGCNWVEANRVLEDWKFPSGAVIKKGTKLTKWLRKMAEEDLMVFNGKIYKGGLANRYGESNLKLVAEYVITMYSQLVSSLTRSDEYLVLSINPLDILTSSFHTSGEWSSCHAPGGAHQTGPISYICDWHTAIAFSYRKTKDFGGFGPYPLKRWRQLVYIDLERRSALHGREYPHNMSEIAKQCRALMAKALADYHGVKHEWLMRRINKNLVKSPEEIDDDEGMFDREECHVENHGEWLYLDAFSSRIKLKDGGMEPRITIGVPEIPCCNCGAMRNDRHNGSYKCRDCRGVHLCKNCEREWGEEQEWDEEHSTQWNGDWYCNNCIDEIAPTCFDCGNRWLADEMQDVAGEGRVCPNCALNYHLCPHCENLTETLVHVNGHDDVCEGCVGGIADLCEECHEWATDTYVCDDGVARCDNCAEEWEAELEEVV